MTRQLKPCATPAAYRRHLRHGETPCKACKAAHAAAIAARGKKPAKASDSRPYASSKVRQLRPCGSSESAYYRHRSRGEVPCADCCRAHAAAEAQRAARRRKAAA